VYFVKRLSPNNYLLALGAVLGVWSLIFAASLTVWGFQNCRKSWKAEQPEFMGFNAMAMISGVTAAILTAVTFLLIFADQAHQEALTASHLPPVVIQTNDPPAQGDPAVHSLKVVSLPPRDALDYTGAVTSVVLGIVGIGGVLVGVSTLRKIDRQTAATELSAKAGELSAKAAALNAQALVNAERPWLVAEVKPDDGLPHHYSIHISNVGRSPATFLSCDAAYLLVERPDLLPTPPEYSSPMTIPAQTLIANGMGFQIPHGYSIPHLLKAHDTAVTLVVYGRVLYGNTIVPDQTHETRWCFGYYFLPDASRPLITGQFVLCGPDEYTRHT
jgi:hypothetical protein